MVVKKIIGISMAEEQELVELAHNGDKQAMNILLEGYFPLIERAAYEYSEYGLEVDDLKQEGMLALYEMILKYDNEYYSGFRWRARNVIYKQYRKILSEKVGKGITEVRNDLNNACFNFSEMVSRESLMEVNESYSDRLREGNISSVYDICYERQLMNMIFELFNRVRLTDNERRALSLYYRDGLNYREIATVMGCNVYAVHKKVIRAIEKIKKSGVYIELAYLTGNVSEYFRESKEIPWSYIKSVMKKIPLLDKEINFLELYYVDGLSYEEIISSMGVSEEELIRLQRKIMADLDANVEMFDEIGNGRGVIRTLVRQRRMKIQGIR